MLESAVPVVIHNKNMLVSESNDVRESIAIDISEEVLRKCRDTKPKEKEKEKEEEEKKLFE